MNSLIPLISLCGRIVYSATTIRHLDLKLYTVSAKPSPDILDFMLSEGPLAVMQFDRTSLNVQKFDVEGKTVREYQL
jgi:hypothetical protein